MTKRSLVAVLALILSLLSPLSPIAAPPAAARDLVLAVMGEPEDGFDPTRGWGDYGSPLFQSTLLKLDANLAVTGDLATAWTLDATSTVWDITLRTDAKFADGVPVTADDVVFTFQTAKTAGGRADVTLVKSIAALAPNRVRIELTEPRVTFFRQLSTLGILPKHAYSPDYAVKPMGSGPFKFVEWRKGEQLVVEPNPYWYGGKVGFDRVTFLFTGEDTSFAAALTGAVQIVAVPPALGASQIPGMTMRAFTTVDNRGLMFPVMPNTGETTKTGAPIGNDVTADIAIRRAVNMSLDRDALVALALDGRGTPARGPADGLPWDNPDAAVVSPDLAGAAAVLDAAGWIPDSDGIRAKGALRASFAVLYPASDSTRQALAVGVADQLRAIGIEAIPSGKSWADIETMMSSNVVVFGWGAHDPLEIYNLYHSKFRGEGWFNTGFYANPAVDAYFDAAQRQPTLEASLPYWRQAQWDGTTGFGSKGDAAWAWLVNLQHIYFISNCLDIGKPQIHPHGHGFPITYAIETWRWTCPE